MTTTTLPDLLAHAMAWVVERDKAIANGDIRRERRADLMLGRKRDEILRVIDYKP